MDYPSQKLLCVVCKESIFNPESGHPVFIKKEYLCDACSLEEMKFYAFNSESILLSIIFSVLEMKYPRRTRRSIQGELKKSVLLKYKFQCAECGEKDGRKLSIDHIKPYSKGGREILDNLQVLCRSCNSKKGAKYAKN
jgi:hypothetical protein